MVNFVLSLHSGFQAYTQAWSLVVREAVLELVVPSSDWLLGLYCVKSASVDIGERRQYILKTRGISDKISSGVLEPTLCTVIINNNLSTGHVQLDQLTGWTAQMLR